MLSLGQKFPVISQNFPLLPKTNLQHFFAHFSAIILPWYIPSDFQKSNMPLPDRKPFSAMLGYSRQVKFSQNLLEGTKFYRICPSVLQISESLHHFFFKKLHYLKCVTGSVNNTTLSTVAAKKKKFPQFLTLNYYLECRLLISGSILSMNFLRDLLMVNS